jgi:hypothetical protein
VCSDHLREKERGGLAKEMIHKNTCFLPLSALLPTDCVFGAEHLIKNHLEMSGEIFWLKETEVIWQ